MQIVRRTLFEAKAFRIGHVVARPSSPEPGEIECQDENVMVLPLAGVFAKHDGAGQYVIGTPNHAVLITSGSPYRISYPAGIGDRCLTLRFSSEALGEMLPQTAAQRGAVSSGLASCGLLPPSAMLVRNLLWHQLAANQLDPLQLEELGSGLLASTLHAAVTDRRVDRRGDSGRRLRAIEVVKEAISLNPERPWTLGDLAQLASLSPYYLAHIFRQETGVPVYRYALRTRLAKALNAVLGSDNDLTAIALEAGFATHSHFTTRFREFFGVTPMALRRGNAGAKADELRKIMIADRIRSP